ncbi:MAG: hypothetical protein ACOCXQ_01635 [Patescibacteria group bacterium]
MKVALITFHKGTSTKTLVQKVHKDLEKEGYSLSLVTIVQEKMEATDLHAQLSKAVKQAEIIVLLVDEVSIGAGILAEYCVSNSKPTLMLVASDLSDPLLSFIDDDKFLIKQYNDRNIKKVLLDGIRGAREKRDKRFNFFISPKLLDYLESTSKDEGITKSKFIRNLIIGDMRSLQE